MKITLKTDAKSYIDWGVDFLKIDNCYYLWDNATFSNPENAKYVFAPNLRQIQLNKGDFSILLNADKGSSLKSLQKQLGITREETMAFGDNLNDLGLLAAAEESYAIGSARDEVKAAAKHIAPPLKENGETEVLLKLLEELENESK